MLQRSPIPKLKILVVDDDRSIRSLVSRAASDWDYEVEESPTAEQALQRLQIERYNIILTDIRMGKIDGIEFAQKVRESMPSTAVIIMTGFPTPKSAQKSQEMGAIYYMTKPLGMDELAETLRIAASWNIGMLVDRAGRRFLALRKGDGRDQANRLKSIKLEIRKHLNFPDAAEALRDFVYAQHIENNQLFRELNDKFSKDSVKPF
ncbi:MAG: response regulator [Spirochaetes bacterium]|nr:response regulator [Spirochaetota bacterium]